MSRPPAQPTPVTDPGQPGSAGSPRAEPSRLVTGPPAPADRRYDVVVVGGGVIGLACAWDLATRGMTVAVVDPEPGRGASWAAAGMLAPVSEVHHGEEALLALALASARRWPGFASELSAAVGRPIGYRTTGTLVVAADDGDRAWVHELFEYQARPRPRRAVAHRSARPATRARHRSGRARCDLGARRPPGRQPPSRGRAARCRHRGGCGGAPGPGRGSRMLGGCGVGRGAGGRNGALRRRRRAGRRHLVGTAWPGCPPVPCRRCDP